MTIACEFSIASADVSKFTFEESILRRAGVAIIFSVFSFYVATVLDLWINTLPSQVSNVSSTHHCMKGVSMSTRIAVICRVNPHAENVSIVG